MSTDSSTSNSLAEREKKAAAGNSILAAVFLTVLKLIVGLITGSLGILAEAAHSLLDLVAAVAGHPLSRLETAVKATSCRMTSDHWSAACKKKNTAHARVVSL